MNSNNEFFSFINAIELNNVPWERLICTNGRASDIPKLLTKLSSLNPQNALSTLNSLSLQIEHQETLWTVAPFALIFMGRCGDKLRVSEHELHKLQTDLSEYFQELLATCNEALKYYDNTKPFTSWQEFFNEEHLLPPINDKEPCTDNNEEEDEEEELDWEDDLPDSPELVLSCYVYSKQVLEFYLNKWQ